MTGRDTPFERARRPQATSQSRAHDREAMAVRKTGQSRGGTADDSPADRSGPASTAGNSTPRRVRRVRRSSRPRATRDFTVRADPPQRGCSLVLRGPLEVAEQDRRTKDVREAGQFLVEQRADLIPAQVGCRVRVRAGERRRRVGRSVALRSRLTADARRHSIKPASDRGGLTYAFRIAGENEERRLEYVLGVRLGAHQPPAQRPDGRAVSGHEFGQRNLSIARAAQSRSRR